jgi:hypothetical protein
MDQLRHGRLNRAFEVVGITYLPQLEPVARESKKRRVATASEAEVIPSKVKVAYRGGK